MSLQPVRIVKLIRNHSLIDSIMKGQRFLILQDRLEKGEWCTISIYGNGIKLDMTFVVALCIPVGYIIEHDAVVDYCVVQFEAKKMLLESLGASI